MDGGGYITGLLFHPAVQGLMYMRTDVGGTYRRDPGYASWTPLNDSTVMDDNQYMGIWSFAIDPNNPDVIYEAVGEYSAWWGATGAILRSTNRGNTWQKINMPQVSVLQSNGTHQIDYVRFGGNENGRGTGERFQVDPNKGNVLFLGTTINGLLKSTDSGTTWNQVATFPTDSSTAFVLFDKSSGTNGNATQTIYVGISSLNARQTLAKLVPTIYRSIDGGNNWAVIPNQPTGLIPLTASLDSQGYLYVAYSDDLGPNGVSTGAVYKLNTATDAWTNITPQSGLGYAGLAVSKTNPNVVFVSTLDHWYPGDEIFRSTDGGSNWTALNAISTHTVPTDDHWFVDYAGGSWAGKMGGWLTTIAIDPFDANHVAYTGGWESDNALVASNIVWDYRLRNMEETCVAKLISPSSGAAHLFTAVGDVAGIRYATNFLDSSGAYSHNTANNNDVDVAEFNTNLVVRTSGSDQQTAYISNDNGVTWSDMPSSPVVKVGTNNKDNGVIAISANGDSMVWVPGYQTAFYSTNGGTSWTQSTGYPTVGGFGNSTFLKPVADRSASGNGYFYSYSPGDGKIYGSVDQGKTFTTLYFGLDTIPDYAGNQGRLISIPGKKGDLWLATDNGLFHFDGTGAPVTTISNVQVAYAIGYGAAAPNSSYFTLYLSGKYNNQSGIFQSIDAGASWTRINDDTRQFGGAAIIAGDPRVFDRVYLGTGCRGTILGER